MVYFFRFFSAKHFHLLSNCYKIISFSVSAQVYKTLNASHTVISKTDLLISIKKKLLQKSKDWNNIDSRRIIIHRNWQVFPTKHIFWLLIGLFYQQELKLFIYTVLSVFIFLILSVALNSSIMTTLQPPFVVPLPVYVVQKLGTMANHVKTLNAE